MCSASDALDYIQVVGLCHAITVRFEEIDSDRIRRSPVPAFERMSFDDTDQQDRCLLINVACLRFGVVYSVTYLVSPDLAHQNSMPVCLSHPYLLQRASVGFDYFVGSRIENFWHCGDMEVSGLRIMT